MCLKDDSIPMDVVPNNRKVLRTENPHSNFKMFCAGAGELA